MRKVFVIAAIAAALLLAGCTSAPPAPTGTDPVEGSLEPIGTPTVLASGLESPWSILRLPEGGSTLISERDSGKIEELTAGGTLRTAGTVAGVVHQGEGGLLGIDALRSGSTTWIYAYTTTETDNRIVRMPLDGKPGAYSLGAPQTILSGLAKAANHDGGRIKFGPDGMLYATVGDAGQPSRAQDETSLNGKILRMTPTGGVPAGNPIAGSLIWSMGHRNPQGLAWDDKGQLWASEFGQDTWDEFNKIIAGDDYGWPIVEGFGNGPELDLVSPDYEWHTDEASPSGLAYVDGTFFMAALRGERLWALHQTGTMNAASFFVGKYGRLRDAVAGPRGTLWILTDNTDGRGSPKPGDDKLLQVLLTSVAAG